MTSDRAEARAQEPGRTDRYYYDLKIQNLGNRPENNLAAGGDEETEEDDNVAGGNPDAGIWGRPCHWWGRPF